MAGKQGPVWLSMTCCAGRDKVPGDRAKSHKHRDNGAAGEAFGRTHRRFIVIPGRDPGIPAGFGGWGDPRITSGDDDD
jgi:hypothetical protein